MSIIAVDVGGTNTKYAVVKKSGEMSMNGYVPTPLNISELTELFEAIAKKAQLTNYITGVACSIAGVVNDKSGVVETSMSLEYLTQFPLKQHLQEKLSLPVSLANDASCAALGEVWHGVAQGVEDVVFLVCGTGVGGALLHNGEVLTGAHLSAGEIGWILLDSINNITLDDASVGKLIKRTAEGLGVGEETLDGEQIFTLAQKGNGIARREIAYMYSLLAHGIYNMQYIFDPEIFVIGGAVSQREDFVPTLCTHVTALRQKVQAYPLPINIKASNLGNNANLLGAAQYFWQTH